MRYVSTISITILFSFAALNLLGCASGHLGERTLLVSGIPYSVSEPGTVFPSAESAAVAALVHTRATSTMAKSGITQAGTIVQTEDGYRWTPIRPSGPALSSSAQRIRLPITDGHVATYIVHPRSGESQIDKMNERFSRDERRFVDGLDPQHRPIFLLTPSGRIVSYTHGGSESQIADLRRGRVDPVFAKAKAADTHLGTSLAAGTR